MLMIDEYKELVTALLFTKYYYKLITWITAHCSTMVYLVTVPPVVHT